MTRLVKFHLTPYLMLQGVTVERMMLSHLCRSFTRLQMSAGMVSSCRTVPHMVNVAKKYHPITSTCVLPSQSVQAARPLTTTSRLDLGSLEYYHKRGKLKKKKKPSVMWGKPQIKGVVLRVLIKKPRKPNSANRKCVRVRLSNGHEVTAYIPGEGHNLQEHSIVLIRGGNVQDLPGVKHKVIRGKYDLAHVAKG